MTADKEPGVLARGYWCCEVETTTRIGSLFRESEPGEVEAVVLTAERYEELLADMKVLLTAAEELLEIGEVHGELYRHHLEPLAAAVAACKERA